MPTRTIEYLTAGEVNGLSPITVPEKIRTLWDAAKPTLYGVYIVVTAPEDRAHNAAWISEKIANWIATKADEYAAKMTAASHYSDLTKGVKVTGKTGHSDMPITAAFDDVGNVGQNNTLSDLQQTETSNDMETPVMRLAEIGERLPNFVREFINEFCDRFALWEPWAEEL